MADDSSSSRKRRRTIPQPDGFLPSKKPAQRIPAPKFQSAFTPQHASSSKPTAKPPGSSRAQFPPAQIIKPPPDNVPKKPVPMRRQPVPPVPPMHVDPQPAKPVITMRRLEPPTIPPIQKSARTTTACKPLSSGILTKESYALPVHVSASKPLQRLVPPAPESGGFARDIRELKPISATHFASITDASFDDDDSADLSSLLLRLQEHKAGVTPSAEDKPDAHISPQKGKHTRGGLAARAVQLFKNTDAHLWRASIETHAHLLQPRPTSSSSLSSASELTLRICNLVHTTYTGTSNPTTTILLCRIHGTPLRPFTSRKHRIYLLLKLPMDSSKTSPLYDHQNLRQGAMIRIFRPWFEVDLGGGSVIRDMPNSSLPLPLSNESDSGIIDDNIHPTVLLSSRFAIIQENS